MTLMVCQTPVKLTPITSAHCSSVISQSQPTLSTPALATTMSSQPQLGHGFVDELLEGCKISHIHLSDERPPSLAFDERFSFA